MPLPPEIDGLQSEVEAGTVTTPGKGVGSPSLALTATTGFCYIPTCAGTPTGVPAPGIAGMVPLVFDTTGVKLWIRTGGTWKGVVVA